MTNPIPEFQTIVFTHGPEELESFDAKLHELMADGWITSWAPFVYKGALCQQMSRWPKQESASTSSYESESAGNVSHDEAIAAVRALNLLQPGPTE